MAYFDLICPSCSHQYPDVWVAMEEPKPPCLVCDTQTIKNWATSSIAIQGDGYGSAPKVDMGALGQCETRGDLNRAVGKIKERFPGHSVVIEEDTPQMRQQRTEERMSKVWERRKARGITEQDLKQYDAARKNAEARGHKGAAVLPKSLGQLMGAPNAAPRSNQLLPAGAKLPPGVSMTAKIEKA